VEDFTTRRLTVGDFCTAASSCMVPMTLVSLTVERLVEPSMVVLTFRWTTVSTAYSAITRATVGLRMSARTKV